MPELDDHQLLTQFARDNSEAAFGTLVGRYLNLVYSTARRSLGDAHAVEEVSQAVFIVLARKAKGFSPKVVLSGWLYQTTRLTAANFLRGEMRRRQREQEAYMQSVLNEPGTDEAWGQIAPLLDDALDKLGSRDRDAIALRFFENKTLGEVGRTLGASEDAAKMRVNRALEKLRTIFKKRGVTLTTTLIAGAVSANSVQAAPAGLAGAFSATATGGAAISTTMTTLVKGTMKTMTWLKIKFAAGAGLAALVVGGAATVAVSQISHTDRPAAREIIKQSEERARGFDELHRRRRDHRLDRRERGCSSRVQHQTGAAQSYRVEWKQDMGFFVHKGVAWSAGDGDFMQMLDRKPEKHADREGALSSATGVSGGAAGSIPGTFFKMNWGNQLGATMQSADTKPDEKINGVDCYVLTDSKNGRTRTLWIGKQDFLIRRIETLTSAANLKTVLEAQAQKHPEMKLPTTASGDVRSVETHSNIVVNAPFSPADFAR